MGPIYTQTGGGYASDFSMLRLPDRLPTGATWPFVKIFFFSDHIDLKLMGDIYGLALSDIESVHRVIAAPILGDGIQIIHYGSAPKILVFWSLFRSKRLLREFSKRGVPITKTIWGDPRFKKPKV